jgi:hypothetical protein
MNLTTSYAVARMVAAGIDRNAAIGQAELYAQERVPAGSPEGGEFAPSGGGMHPSVGGEKKHEMAKAAHNIALPKNRKLSIDQASSALGQMGYTLGRSHYDAKTKTMAYEITHPNGSKSRASIDEVKEIVYRGQQTNNAKDASGHEHAPAGSSSGGQFVAGQGAKTGMDPEGKVAHPNKVHFEAGKKAHAEGKRESDYPKGLTPQLREMFRRGHREAAAEKQIKELGIDPKKG